MATRQEDHIRERAYHLWQESGGEHGREMEYWLQAEREVAHSEGGPSAAAAPKDGKGDAPRKAAAATVKPAATKQSAAKPSASAKGADKPAAAKSAATAKPKAVRAKTSA